MIQSNDTDDENKSGAVVYFVHVMTAMVFPHTSLFDYHYFWNTHYYHHKY